MLRFRPLPLLVEIERLSAEGHEKEALARRNAAAVGLFHSEGIQFVAKMLRDIQLEALSSITQNMKPDFNVGRLAAVEDIRQRLIAILPDNDDVKWVEENDAEEPWIYDSGFDIPYPTSG